MKKKLLFVSLLATGMSFGQTFTQANEPAIGSSVTMYLLDSNATNYQNIIGNGAIWDYSQTGGYPGEMRTITIVDPSTTPLGSTYPNSNKAVVVENFLTTYWNSSASDRKSPGFVFYEPTFGNVVAEYNASPQILATYPFALNNTAPSNYSGMLSFSFNQIPLSPDATGISLAKLDGIGTLKLNAATTHENVMRYVLIDTLNTVLPIVNEVQLIRKQYEYYLHSVSDMPLFTHTYAIMAPPGGASFLEFTVVLSSAQPDSEIHVSTENLASNSFSVYPNPVKNALKIQGDFNNALNGKIYDLAGKEVAIFENYSANNEIQVSHLEAGIYVLNVQTEKGFSTVRFIKE
jgi:hypothetical protein